VQVTVPGTVAQDGEDPISYLEVAVRKHRTTEGTVYDKVILSVFDSPAAATRWLEAAPPIGQVSGIQPTQHGNVLKSVSNSTLVAKDRPPPPDEDAAIDGCIAPQ
jgi:hypothetical protein